MSNNEGSSSNIVEIREDSKVIRVNNETRRCHLTTLLPFTSTEVDAQGDKQRTPINFRVYLEAAGYLALRHFNDRDPKILPSLSDTLQNCDVELTVDMRDTQFSPIEAARQFEDIFLHSNHSLEDPLPFALLGAARSAVSQTLAILAGVYEVPQISASSTSASLDNKETFPFFARTVPSNAGDAKALILHLAKLGVTHVGVIFVRDSYGSAYHAFIQEAGYREGIDVVSSPFDNDASIPSAVERLRKSGVKYIFGIFNPSTWKTVIRRAIDAGIVGQPGYSWLFSEASLEFTQPGFELDRIADGDLARAIHGSGVVLIDVPNNPELDEAMGMFETNTDLQQEFVSKHREPFVFEGFDWTYPGMALYQYLHYDAVISLGLAACRAKNTFFTGPEFYQTLMDTEFEGVSGYVSFDRSTGTRNSEYLKYRIENVLLSDSLATENAYRFASQVAVKIDFRSGDSITQVAPYVYFDNSTIPPLALPPVAQELNLISNPIRIFGLLLCASAIICSLGWCAWTWLCRKTDVVRISQPIFLVQLCVGTIILASSIIPMSMQEPISQRGLDIACMATPWLLSIGFVTSFAALFSKSLRLNRLFQSGMAMRRIQVKAQDVMLPFVVLMTINLALLIVWTTVAPLSHSRHQVENFDSFGRSVESYGTCYVQEDKFKKIVQTSAVVGLAFVNIAGLVFANYQCYLARNVPTDFNESFYVAVTNAGILEAFILGGPILFLVTDNPSADFLVKSLLVTIVSFTILLPVFIPKALQRRLRRLRLRHDMSKRKINLLVRKGGHTSLTPPQQVQQGNSNRINESQVQSGTSMVTRNDDFWVQHRSSVVERESANGLRGRTGGSGSGSGRRRDGSMLSINARPLENSSREMSCIRE